jgi:hypothetical protein
MKNNLRRKEASGLMDSSCFSTKFFHGSISWARSSDISACSKNFLRKVRFGDDITAMFVKFTAVKALTNTKY